jgi:hypothetical protein
MWSRHWQSPSFFRQSAAGMREVLNAMLHISRERVTKQEDYRPRQWHRQIEKLGKAQAGKGSEKDDDPNRQNDRTDLDQENRLRLPSCGLLNQIWT